MDSPPANPGRPDSETNGYAARRVFAALLATALAGLFTWMCGRLLVGVLMGIVLWSMTGWMYSRFFALFGRRATPAALASVAGTILLFIVPATVLIYLAIADATNLANSAHDWLEPYLPELEKRYNQLTHGGTFLFGMKFTMQDIAARLQSSWGTAGAFVLAATKKISGSLLDGFLLLFVMLYTQFFFYFDGPRFLGWFVRLLPLARPHAQRLVDDFFATSRSTLKTLAVIGAIQGGLGGLGFWVAGVPAPIFWAVVMAFCSVIPSVGAQIVLVPASIVLIVIGSTWAGIGLLLWSVVVIASIDNLVRPVIVKRDINLHELLVLVSTLGGITMFGFFGVIIGPVIASMLKASLRIYAETHAEDQAPESQERQRAA